MLSLILKLSTFLKFYMLNFSFCPVNCEHFIYLLHIIHRIDNSHKIIKVAVVGKYTQLSDAYASVTRSLVHAAAHINHKVAITVIIYHIKFKMASIYLFISIFLIVC